MLLRHDRFADLAHGPLATAARTYDTAGLPAYTHLTIGNPTAINVDLPTLLLNRLELGHLRDILADACAAFDHEYDTIQGARDAKATSNATD